MEMTPALESFSLFPFLSFITTAPLAVAPTQHPLLVSPGTLAAFYRQHALTFEAQGSRWRRHGLRR